MIVRHRSWWQVLRRHEDWLPRMSVHRLRDIRSGLHVVDDGAGVGDCVLRIRVVIWKVARSRRVRVCSTSKSKRQRSAIDSQCASQPERNTVRLTLAFRRGLGESVADVHEDDQEEKPHDGADGGVRQDSASSFFDVFINVRVERRHCRRCGCLEHLEVDRKVWCRVSSKFMVCLR